MKTNQILVDLSYKYIEDGHKIHEDAMKTEIEQKDAKIAKLKREMRIIN